MAIADELRKYAANFMSNVQMHRVLAIADCIDAEHLNALDNEHQRAYEQGKNSILAVFDKNNKDIEDLDETMAEHGWYRALGKDMQPIKFFDMMVRGGDTRCVAGIGPECFFAWSYEDSHFHQFDADEWRHYHAPTVEDLLCKLVGRAQALGCIEDEDALVAEYAKKLQLRGDE